MSLVSEGTGGLNWEQLAADECRETGVTFASGVIDLLVAKINGNARLFVEEARKLITYCDPPEGEIDERMVDEIVPAFGEGDFFEAAEAFFSRDPTWSVRALQRHFFAGYDSRPLLIALQNRNRLLIQIRALQDGGALGSGGLSKASLNRAAGRYGSLFGNSTDKNPLNVFTQNPWYLGKLIGRGTLPTLRTLVDHQFEFRQAFAELIERPNEQEAVLQAMFLRCLSPGRAA